jgi:hypothetical protein
MGLRFYCVGGWGWVVGMGGCIVGCAHHLEKSTANFMGTSIHCLFYWKGNFREFGASFSENEARNVCRNAWETVVR